MSFSKYLVMGAGRSGVGISRLLLKNGAEVTLYDDCALDKLNFFKNSALAQEKALRTSFAQEPKLSNYQALVISPGISFEHKLIQKAKLCGLSIMSEIDCAYKFLPELTIIGITGTNGKSTTTVMIEHILRSQNMRVLAGGNLGVPLSELALSAREDNINYIILELSSFQLEHIHNLKLDIAVILNITPDHLDRHKSFEAYEEAKLKIINLANNNLIIANKNLENIISNYKNINININTIWFNQQNLKFITMPNISGSHNQENAQAAFCVALQLGINKKNILKALSSYKPLPHRCELVAIKNNISYIDDSKGTTVVAVSKALSLTQNRVHLLLGGQAKGEDFSILGPQFFSHIAGYYVYGQAQAQIMNALNTSKASSYENLSQAFNALQSKLLAGDTVLLSPGCASYDQFSNYIERAQLFRALVEKL